METALDALAQWLTRSPDGCSPVGMPAGSLTDRRRQRSGRQRPRSRQFLHSRHCALNASEQLGISSRAQSAAATGGSIVNVDRYEQVIADQAQPPKAGAFVRLNTVAGTPDKIDNVINFMQKQALPLLQGQKGYRATFMNVDRMTGRSTVSTVWDTMADLEASEPKVSGLRTDAADAAGASDVKVEIFEAAFAEIKQPSRA